MAKKQYFAIVDTETTIKDTVADFAIIICDKQGIIHNQMACLVKDNFDSMDLFYDRKATGLWSFDYARQKRIKYNEMLNNGSRIMASANAVNKWINLAIGKYNPTLTAYNLAFDAGKCANTNIDLTGFKDRFCLWQAAVGNICKSKAFKQFALDNHQFNNVTKHGNMTFKTTAETVTGFINNQMTDEPHTALEDIIGWELPIFKKIIARRDWKEKIIAHNWQDFQVKNHFKAK
ncbi:hypothetical protein UFOVP961_104 [uncultured Caudovirales phage]|uniref:Uncharacterized protein n=1 Tax=uncultured Caudovirales phage TaxID=2100421 RepID=A0A6J5SNI1_9CAUD|nr:hypothetical protein UFOVP961_104 [uncultured Caudovirales phage]CAB4185200.1 hypothetical protein UFOVP1123_32 [uncultured Caudovirales phage]CAB4193626.1 hypothetical protein UFOVP1239_118 [uncultured Caudovirales phage]CAB4215881.1 hypothetical protein UFOVP1484_36 [uncultured Caudovirales phage]CAB5230654.1 hypothetical protein UFOVP1577_42 [uncultured Caudovirales phage]